MASDVGAAATTAVILSRDRLSQNSENQPAETTTMRVYTFTARIMSFRNSYVACAFVVCVKIINEDLIFSRLKIHIILVLDRVTCLVGVIYRYPNITKENNEKYKML